MSCFMRNFSMKRFQLPLSGLKCMGCAKKLEQHFKQEFEVQIHQLSPTFIELSTSASLSELIAAIESLGYQALLSTNSDPLPSSQPTTLVSDTQPLAQETEVSTTGLVSTHLLIQGMTCASCVSSVEKALLSVNGVQKAQINLAEQSALVLSQADIADLERQLLNAITHAGYRAERVDDPAQQQEKQKQQSLDLQKQHKTNALLGLIMGIPLMLWGLLGGSMMIVTTQQQIYWGVIGIVCLALLATAGRHFFSHAWLALIHKRATMDSLVALGTGAAWAYSMLVVIYPTWFPIASRHVYFEASAMIIGLISLGHYIEAKAKAKTTQSLQALINLQPQQATRITAQGDQQIAVELVQLGMQLRIKPGEKVPIDGKVLSGESYVDESMLTGEPIPVLKVAGDAIAAGTINHDGSLVIEATGVGAQTMLSRIIQMVRQAQSSKPAIAKLADQISAIFVPTVIMIALFSALIWYFVGPEPKASYMLVVATTVLIIACPCALGLATPLSVTVGVGKAAEMGILIRDANVLQSASKITTVVFDKTGTLTQGKPTVQNLVTWGIEDNKLLTLVYALELRSEHPLGKAICHYAQPLVSTSAEVEQFTNLRGKGLMANIGGDSVVVASLSHLESLDVPLTQAQTTIEHYAEQAWTPVAVAINGELKGLIAIADPIKPNAAQAISTLNKMNIRTVMLTGDNQSVATAIAKQIGIQQVIAQVLPDQKAQKIVQLQEKGQIVAMVGDGINDAPALAQADIGIAMGSGSDVAIESAQMTLLNSSPLAVVNAIALSKATVKNMKQNLLGAFIYNTFGIPIAAGVLYPAFGFLLSPVVAGAAMALSSITVVSNANRLRLFKSPFHS
ncbi:copper-translocating P-type ATPase [Vibrio sp. B4-12]|nr:copper-translocating P-type ATPase [Vibrio sp. A14(2019)]MDQ2197190.1 copper-translocating P-type ATPase [Vibrio sp. 2017_1457_11]NNN76448.1 copper-translocating P-type ATPase [Vibrio sp. B7]NNN92954.1 copper-translocating P-type ATPase [Vibrio sp. B8-1]NNO08538.1 copper-translocating P-type ATPase [Vibrio sp. B4-12]